MVETQPKCEHVLYSAYICGVLCGVTYVLKSNCFLNPFLDVARYIRHETFIL